jgi:hypothetical protein
VTRQAAQPHQSSVDERPGPQDTAERPPERDEEPSWIMMKEAATLFSSEGGAYAFGEGDEAGKSNLAAFAASSGGVQFEFMPIEGQLFFEFALKTGRHGRAPGSLKTCRLTICNICSIRYPQSTITSFHAPSSVPS